MELHPHLQEATFVLRLNRFVARMRVDERDVLVHIANSGRLTELLRPQNRMLVAPAPEDARRKTAYDLALVEVDGCLVSADARLPNTLVREAIEARRLPQFGGYDRLLAEVTVGDSRIDLVLSGRLGSCYIEVKSVTLVEDGVGLFPDAPTERGRKHVSSLRRIVRSGHRAAAVFVVQRPDARAFSPNRLADPDFCRALSEAVESGVETHAFRCRVSRARIELWDAVPVRMP